MSFPRFKHLMQLQWGSFKRVHSAAFTNEEPQYPVFRKKSLHPHLHPKYNPPNSGHPIPKSIHPSLTHSLPRIHNLITPNPTMGEVAELSDVAVRRNDFLAPSLPSTHPDGVWCQT